MRLMRRWGAGLLMGAALGVLCAATGSSAQETPVQVFGLKLDGEITSGIQFFLDEPNPTRSAKFEEYRSVPEGLFLENLRLRLTTQDNLYSFWLEGSKWGRRDQEFTLGAGRVGLWETQFEWDQTPHVFSRRVAQLLSARPNDHVFVLPSPRPPLANYNQGKVLDEVSLRWDTARLSLFLTPTPDWEIKSSYTRIHKEGERAITMAFLTPMNNFIEVLEPVNQDMHDFRIGATYARESWQVMFSYAFSLFENFRTSVIADNPCFQQPLCVNDTNPGAAAQARARVSLAPSNMAHTVSLSGGLNLPMRTRVSGTVSFSARLQNDFFLPPTNNQLLIGDPFLFLQDKTLDGLTTTFLANLNATSRPIPPLTLTAKYRVFNLHDMGNQTSFAHGVETDSIIYTDSGSASPFFGPQRTAHRFGYTKQNAEADARWRFNPTVALTLGIGWEGWDRSRRNVEHSDDAYARAVLDVNPADWLLAQLIYRPSFRRNSNYDSTPTNIATNNSPLMRKWDQAERDRQRVDLMLQSTVTESITAAVTGSWYYDNFNTSPITNSHETPLGVQSAVNWSTGADVTWTPSDRFSLTTGYVHEWLFTKQRGRSQSPGIPDNLTYLYISDNADTIDTFRAIVNGVVIPKRLDFSVGASYANAVGHIDSRNPLPPSGGSAKQNQDATAKRFPAFVDQLLRLDAGLTYHFDKMWKTTFGYAFESWQYKDFRTDTLQPWVPGPANVIFLGEKYQSYTAHIVGVTLGVQFK
jgi:MtrB/PioB family decaheme-associated outer membrane protein